VEQSDFAKGTSSRSTKLIHGGVRYLKQGDIALVRHALIERGRLLHNAPHLAQMREFVIPNYSHFDHLFYGVGLKFYDGLAGRLGVRRSQLLSCENTMSRLPTLINHHLKGGVSYYDGQFDDARLAVNLAQTASEYGAVLVNYCQCVGFIHQNGRVAGIRVRDSEPGANGDTFEIFAKAVVNATGVFVDDLRTLDDPHSTEMVTVSQGTHLVLPKKFLPGESALMVPKTADGRVLFAVPWHECLILGTTDIPRPAADLEPRPLPEEYEFLMTHARKYLSLAPSDGDVLSVFAGLRPLVKAKHSGSTARLSRDHTIAAGKSGLLTITGGKWTTYRHMAEDLLGFAQKLNLLEARPCTTADMRLHGAGTQDQPDHSAPLSVYGTDADGIRALAAKDPSLAQPLHPAFPYLRAEVIWHVRHEMARTVEDVLARRTRALLLNARVSAQAAPAVAQLMAAELGRNSDWQRSQCQAYAQLARGYTVEGSNVAFPANGAPLAFPHPDQASAVLLGASAQ